MICQFNKPFAQIGIMSLQQIYASEAGTRRGLEYYMEN